MGLFQSKLAVVAPPVAPVAPIAPVVDEVVIVDDIEEQKIEEIVIISPIIDDIVRPFEDDDVVHPFVEAISKKKKRRKSKD